MRITILAIAALSIISITQASYILNIPMEQGQGGALSNGSIKFTTRTPPIPVETATCYYNSINKTYWMSGTNSANNAYLIYVNGGLIKVGRDYTTTSFTVNGKTYKRGTTIKSRTTTYEYYEVCE